MASIQEAPMFRISQFVRELDHPTPAGPRRNPPRMRIGAPRQSPDGSAPPLSALG